MGHWGTESVNKLESVNGKVGTFGRKDKMTRVFHRIEVTTAEAIK